MFTNRNNEVDYSPQVVEELTRKVEIVNGAEVITYVPVVLPEFPPADDFSLEKMIKAGISPESINISTQNVDRLDGLDKLQEFMSEADSLLNPTNPN